jgi:hypothetical protein
LSFREVNSNKRILLGKHLVPDKIRYKFPEFNGVELKWWVLLCASVNTKYSGRLPGTDGWITENADWVCDEEKHLSL